MKLILLIVVLGLAAGCSGAKTDSDATNSNKTGQAELQVDVVRQQAEKGPVVEFTFYQYTYGPSNGSLQNVTAKTVVEVENASLNGVAMTRETDAAGEPIFKVKGNDAKKENEISASFAGRSYTGTVVLTGKPNSMTRVTMRPAG
ncbi:MAG: hypothetical protein WBD27_00860 [Pyrinomonadaceae bacterium]